MKILGYSERGAINALMFEISFSADSKGQLRRLLDKAIFLGCEAPTDEITSTTAFVEQSLSDFGDADAILLIDRSDARSAVFVEGKVRASQSKPWTLEEQFTGFQQGLASTLSSSNLFAQLYHKVRFARAAIDGQSVESGVEFPACSSKRVRRIGTNPVVRRAMQMIGPYLRDPYYLAIVPDSPENVRRFVERTLVPFAHDDLEHWDVSRWGFLCWTDIHDFSLAENLHTTRAVLEFNQGQIC